MEDREYMRQALALAREAARDGEVPVGCVVVCRGNIVGRGRNRRETGRTALGHAEIEAISQACHALGGWRLWECALYVTLEPCPMCAGAIINARIPRVIYGAADPKNGACGSVCNLFELPFNHRPAVEGGVLAEECAGELRAFFRRLRETPRAAWRERREEDTGGSGAEKPAPGSGDHCLRCGPAAGGHGVFLPPDPGAGQAGGAVPGDLFGNGESGPPR